MITPEEVQETIQYATGYSLYAYEQELKQGYITIEGGHPDRDCRTGHNGTEWRT